MRLWSPDKYRELTYNPHQRIYETVVRRTAPKNTVSDPRSGKFRVACLIQFPTHFKAPIATSHSRSRVIETAAVSVTNCNIPARAVDAARAESLVQLLAHRGCINAGPPDPTGFGMVINTTPLGMHPNDPSPILPDLLTGSMFVGDVVAGHGQTPLLMAARDAGCKTADGSQMVDAGVDLMVDFLLTRSNSHNAASSSSHFEKVSAGKSAYPKQCGHPF